MKLQLPLGRKYNILEFLIKILIAPNRQLKGVKKMAENAFIGKLLLIHPLDFSETW